MPRHSRRTARDQRRRQHGQNFLVDKRAIQRFIDVAAPTTDDLIVEVCAGKGALTQALAARGCRVIAIEIDGRWASHLQRDLAHNPKVRAVAADALTAALPGTPFRVVGSVAFGISTSLVRRLLMVDGPLIDATLLLQWEAARRMSGASTTGKFALTWAPWFELTVVDRIHRKAFRPIPEVDAGVLTLRSREVPWLSPACFAEWNQFLVQVFGAQGRTAEERLAATALTHRDIRRLPAETKQQLQKPPSRVPATTWTSAFRAARRRPSRN